MSQQARFKKTNFKFEETELTMLEHSLKSPEKSYRRHRSLAVVDGRLGQICSLERKGKGEFVNEAVEWDIWLDLSLLKEGAAWILLSYLMLSLA